jgi:enoyl-CoA hydratase/carnithine racemase
MDDASPRAAIAYGGFDFKDFRAELSPPGILVITFDAPDRMNALTQGMKRDLIELVTRVQMDDAVRVVVFTGTGRGFCAGDHMGGYAEHAPVSMQKIGRGHTTGIGTANALRVYSQGLNLAVRSLDKLTIAAINGHAIQTGLCWRSAATSASGPQPPSWAARRSGLRSCPTRVGSTCWSSTSAWPKR